jgi:hypothetical protein
MGPDQFERFNATVMKIFSVPRSEMVRRQEECKRRSARNPNRRVAKKRAKS